MSRRRGAGVPRSGITSGHRHPLRTAHEAALVTFFHAARDVAFDYLIVYPLALAARVERRLRRSSK